jgi:hypothetical protein
MRDTDRKLTKNGHRILQQSVKDGREFTIVICDLGHEFCIWAMDPKGNCYWGDYCQDITVAANKYADRCRKHVRGYFRSNKTGA